MESQHSHSLRDTKPFDSVNNVSRRSRGKHLIIAGALCCLVLVALAMVILNPDSIIQRGALAITIVSLATMLNAKSSISDLKVFKNSDHNSTLNKLSHEDPINF